MNEIIPVNDARYPSRNIRLSAALIPLGFPLKLEAQPCGVAIDAETEKRVVTFYHEPVLTPESAAALPELAKAKISATDIDAWWRYPRKDSKSGSKFSIPGFDDALMAMRRVGEDREWILGLIHGSQHLAARSGRGGRVGRKDSISTDSLHAASVIKACGFDLLHAERRGGQKIFIFPAQAVPVLELIAKADQPLSSGLRPLSSTGKDPCVDWMLWWLKYRDWLARIVRDPENIPMIDMRDGERVLSMSAKMHPKQQKDMLRAF